MSLYYYTCAEKKKEKVVQCNRSQKEFQPIENPADFTNFQLFTMRKDMAEKSITWISYTRGEEQRVMNIYKDAKEIHIVDKDQPEIMNLFAPFKFQSTSRW